MTELVTPKLIWENFRIYVNFLCPRFLPDNHRHLKLLVMESLRVFCFYPFFCRFDSIAPNAISYQLENCYKTVTHAISMESLDGNDGRRLADHVTPYL